MIKIISKAPRWMKHGFSFMPELLSGRHRKQRGAVENKAEWRPLTSCTSSLLDAAVADRSFWGVSFNEKWGGKSHIIGHSKSKVGASGSDEAISHRANVDYTLRNAEMKTKFQGNL